MQIFESNLDRLTFFSLSPCSKTHTHKFEASKVLLLTDFELVTSSTVELRCGFSAYIELDQYLDIYDKKGKF